MDSMESYRISEERGFFLENPLTELPGKHSAWIDLMRKLPILYDQKLLRERIHELPLMDGSELQTHNEIRLGHFAVAILASAYIWQNIGDDPPSMLPEALAVPLYKLSSRLGVEPIISYADLVLSNVRFLKPLDDIQHPVEDMSLEFTFLNDKNEYAFLTITGLCELKCRRAIKPLLEAVRISNENGQENDQSILLAQHLKTIKSIVEEVKLVMPFFHKTLDPQVFHNRILPLLAGWDPTSPVYPNGLIYEGVSDKPIVCYGPNAAQTPVFQCIDGLLGIEHRPAQAQVMKNKTRKYMIKEHRQFICDIEKHSRVKEIVAKGKCLELTTAYNDLVSALEAFRTYHVSLVTKYVVIPARTKVQEIGATEGIGDGNPFQELISHLKSARDGTKGSKLPVNNEGEPKTSES